MGSDEIEDVGTGIELAAHLAEAPGEAPGTETYPLRAVAAALAIGCVALLMLGVQPLVLGGLLAAHRLSVSELSWAATAEMLALGGVSAGLASLAPPRRLVLVAAASLAVFALANFAGLVASGAAVVACRTLVGVAGGVQLWIVTGLITRSRAAVRISAIFLGAQSLSQAVLAAATPLLVGRNPGDAGFILMGLVAIAGLPLALLLPDSLRTLPHATTGGGRIAAPGALGLCASFLMMAGVVGLWVFIEPLGRTAGVGERAISFTIAGSLAAQILGAAAIAVFGPRISAVPGLVAVALGDLLLVGLFGGLHGAGVFVPAALAFGVLWTAGLPLVFPLLVKVDPTRRVALYSSGAQLLGSAAGPVVTGLFATEANVRPVLVTSGLLFCAAILSIVLAGRLAALRRG